MSTEPTIEPTDDPTGAGLAVIVALFLILAAGLVALVGVSRDDDDGGSGDLVACVDLIGTDVEPNTDGCRTIEGGTAPMLDYGAWFMGVLSESPDGFDERLIVGCVGGTWYEVAPGEVEYGPDCPAVAP